MRERNNLKNKLIIKQDIHKLDNNKSQGNIDNRVKNNSRVNVTSKENFDLDKKINDVS